jgi:hypothetical protein
MRRHASTCHHSRRGRRALAPGCSLRRVIDPVRLPLSGRRGRTDGPRGRSRPAKEQVHRRLLYGGTSARLRRRHPRRRLAGEPRRGPRPGCRNGPTQGRLLPTLRPGDRGWPGRTAAGRAVAVPASPSRDTTGRVRRRADQPRTRPTPTAAGSSARPRGSSRSAPARHRSLLHRDTAGSARGTRGRPAPSWTRQRSMGASASTSSAPTRSGSATKTVLTPCSASTRWRSRCCCGVPAWWRWA